MSNIFFHIGLHKTGTGWFQRVLFPSLEEVSLLRPRRIEDINLEVKSSRALIISWEGLSGSISHRKPPGFNSRRIVKAINFITNSAPKAAVIIGFREHTSWLNAAFSQKAKKRGDISLEKYANKFSRDDLSWCQKLEIVESSCTSVFPFLYEELLHSPTMLIDDLCYFLGTKPPPHLGQLLSTDVNPSPRSHAGRFVSKYLSPLLPRQRRWKGYCYKLGTQVDRYFPASPINLNPEISRDLQPDWINLLHLIGKRRNRDFSALSRYS